MTTLTDHTTGMVTPALLQDSILVAGYPLGGDSLSITKGIVSRVRLLLSCHIQHARTPATCVCKVCIVLAH